VFNIEQTAPFDDAQNTPGTLTNRITHGIAMQDRDSFYYRAIRTKPGDREQYDLKVPLPRLATGEMEAKGHDLDDPEPRRRFKAGAR
jgi:hypothetical protein